MGQLNVDVHSAALRWFSGLPRNPKQQIQLHYGDFPEAITTNAENIADASTAVVPIWTWYLAAILPLSQESQLAMLATMSLRERLISLRHVLDRVQRREMAARWLGVIRGLVVASFFAIVAYFFSPSGEATNAE